MLNYEPPASSSSDEVTELPEYYEEETRLRLILIIYQLLGWSDYKIGEGGMPSWEDISLIIIRIFNKNKKEIKDLDDDDYELV